jgi:hypothetical protein
VPLRTNSTGKLLCVVITFEEEMVMLRQYASDDSAHSAFVVPMKTRNANSPMSKASFFITRSLV